MKKIFNEIYDRRIKEICKTYSQIDFDNLVYRFQDGITRFSFTDKAKNLHKIIQIKKKGGETKVKNAKTKKKQLRFFETNLKGLRKGYSRPE